jgi:hypothetical protein
MLARHLNQRFNPSAATSGWLALKAIQLKHNGRHPTRRRDEPQRAPPGTNRRAAEDVLRSVESAKLTATPTRGKLERQLQLIVPLPLEQFAYRVTDEPGEGNTVFLCQRRQLLVVPLVDADRDPRC